MYICAVMPINVYKECLPVGQLCQSLVINIIINMRTVTLAGSFSGTNMTITVFGCPITFVSPHLCHLVTMVMDALGHTGLAVLL